MKEDGLKKKLLRILYISQYFPPEVGATQTRAFEMASNLVRRGHRVTVLTEFPNHPLGVIPSQYRHKLFTRENMAGIDVIRTWVFTRPEKNLYVRLAFYFSFMVLSILRAVFIQKKFDVVYATSPPLFVAVSGFVISIIKRSRFVLEIRDLWPESAVVLGELSSSLLIGLSEKLETLLYKKAIRIVMVTRGICSRLKEMNIPGAKLSLIPNGANTDLYQPGEKDRALLRSLGIRDSHFVVMYTGLHGLMHGLEFVIEAACEFQRDPELFFVFIGDGVMKSRLICRWIGDD
jgi:colanic acid biosynthesis glycosyl transferase WcaI